MEKTTPGRTGLPILGETPAFAKDSFAFVSQRHREHGAVFITNVLFRKTYVLVGPEAAAAFSDPANVARAGSLPPNVARLFSVGAVNQLDGEEHRRRKGHIMAAMTPGALADYLPGLRRLMREAVARWNGAGQVVLQPELKLLTARIAAENLMGVQEEALAAQLVELVEATGAAFGGVPFPLPGTALRRALSIQRVVFARYEALANARRQSPGKDGLSRMMSSEIEGERLEARWAIGELHHMVLAGFITWSVFADGLVRLTQEPELLARLKAAAEALPDEPGPRAYVEAPGLAHFADELKRTSKVVPIIFGMAQRDFEVEGHTIPQGAAVLLGIYSGHNDPAAPYDAPETFDPDRFAEGRAEHKRHPAAFHPQGAGSIIEGHKCAGFDYSSLMIQVFFAELLRGAPFSVPPQDLSRNMALIPPDYIGGLKVHFGQ